jgi:hypothetical protein
MKPPSAKVDANRPGRFVSTWNWCRRDRAMTAQIRANAVRGTLACPTSDMLLTNTRRGVRHPSGSLIASSWTATPNPGPLVRGSPSRWYFADPIALSRLASVSA